MPASLLTVTPLTASGISHVADNIPQGVGLVVWFDATKISGVTSGTSLSAWTDVSGNGSHVSNSKATQQPLFVANVINGLPAVRFDGTNTFLSNSASAASQAPVSVFFVSTSSNTGVTKDLGNAGNLHWGESGSPTRFTTSGVKDYTTGSFFTQGTPVTVSMIFDSGFTVTFYRNGSLFTAIGGTGDPGNTNTVSIGGVSAANVWPGDVGEFLLFKTALSTANRQTVESYLTNKWATA